MKTKYAVGDYVMHDTSGVCQITDISEMALQGKGSEKLYYLMTPIFQTGSRIFTPVDQAQRIRDVSSKADMEELIEAVPDLEIVEEDNNKVRTELFRDMMNQFDPTVLATVVKTVYIRKQRRIAAGKKVMSSDEKVMAVAGKKLFEEMAFALHEERAHVEELFFGRLTEDVEKCIKSV
ncbi:transcriptional regulator, CarD family [Lachnospiraceae bacterium XBD2001]|nr:transcriptional regulator, CarD family [Lachnospiraceae bacterium XBD2001]